MKGSMKDGYCPKRKDHTHCIHWWDGEKKCCDCAFGEDRIFMVCPKGHRIAVLRSKVKNKANHRQVYRIECFECPEPTRMKVE